MLRHYIDVFLEQVAYCNMLTRPMGVIAMTTLTYLRRWKGTSVA